MKIKPFTPFEVSQKSLPSFVKTKEQEQLWKVATEFESIFIKQMLDAMRKTLNKNSLLDGGITEDIFEDMLYQERAVSMAKTANFGLTKTLYHQLNQIQGLKVR